MCIRDSNKSGMDKEQYWEHLANGPETLCVYMGVKRLPEICDLLTKHGRSSETPVALVHMGTSIRQKTITGTLGNIVDKAHQITNPAMIIIGDVVRMREKINWFVEQADVNKLSIPKVTSK